MTLFIVSEDQLSEIVIQKMITRYKAFSNHNIASLGKQGRGYIQRKINDFNKQNRIPFFILADLDSDECAPGLIKKWMKGQINHNILLRFAVREVEAWLLADTKGFSNYTKLDHSLIIKEVDKPDKLTDPKGKLISLVDRSRNRVLKNDIVQKNNHSYKQGPGYNSRLSDYINNYWEIERAVASSDSFKRAVNSLVQFNKGYENEKY